MENVNVKYFELAAQYILFRHLNCSFLSVLIQPLPLSDMKTGHFGTKIRKSAQHPTK